MTTIGLLHPGKMGAAIANTLVQSGNSVLWASTGRSAESHQRAADVGITDVNTVDQLCVQSDIVISICPPHAALDVAQTVADCGFRGIYVDANAISPEKAKQIEAIVNANGATCVDGCVIGLPAYERNKTWVYFSGAQAQYLADCFKAGPLETQVLAGDVGQASALKMCYAAYTKTRAALRLNVLALAEQHGLTEALQRQWDRNWPGFSEQVNTMAPKVSLKAWRWIGEMDEISATFADAGLPDDLQVGAKEVYERLAHFKGADPMPNIDALLAVLLKEV